MVFVVGQAVHMNLVVDFELQEFASEENSIKRA